MTTVPQPKNVIYGAWCLCHPPGRIRYIGQTSKGVNSRWTVHLWHARTETSKSYTSPLSNWIRKHGPENVVFTVLEICAADELDEREISWIAEYRRDLLNILEGGSQPRGHKRPEHSERMKGSGNPMYGSNRVELMKKVRASLSNSISEETRKIWSRNRTGSGNANAKLSEKDVRDMRSRPFRHGLYSSLAREFNVSVYTARAAYKGITWKHVTD